MRVRVKVVQSGSNDDAAFIRCHEKADATIPVDQQPLAIDLGLKVTKAEAGAFPVDAEFYVDITPIAG